MLSGEPGIGKSRPAEELAQRAEKNGAQVLWGRCSEDRGAPAYWPWVQIIRSCIENLETSELRSSLGPDSALIAQIVPELSNLIDQPNDGNHIPEATEAQFRLYDTVLRFLSALSGKKPIVIVLEDLHWADIASLKLLVHFVQGMAQSHIFVVGTYRDVEITRNHPLFQTLGDLTRLRIFSRMQLHGLDPDSVGKIIETHEGVVPPSDLVAAIHSQTEGNPLFVGEMSRFLVQERLIRGELKSNELFDGVGLPEGIREVIGRRLGHLSERAHSILVTAAVIGREFSVDQLVAAEEDDESKHEIADHLEEPLSARVVQEVSGEFGKYQFTHAMIQQVLREELSLTKRVRLHARISESLETLYEDDVEAHASELAFHYAQAEVLLGTEKMIHYSIIAGENALRQLAFADAVPHFERALGAQAENAIDDTKARTLHGYGVAQAAVAEIGKALEATNQAFDYYIETEQNSKAAELSVQSNMNFEDPELGRRARQAVEAVEPGSLYEPYLLALYAMAASLSPFFRDETNADEIRTLALEAASARGDKNAQVVIRSSRAMVYWSRGKIRESLQSAESALGFVDENTRAFPETNAAMWAACCSAHLGMSDRARKYSDQVSNASERTHDPYRILSRIVMATGCISDAVGEFDELLEQEREARALVPGNVTRIGGYVKLAFAGAGAYFEQGRTTSGRKLFDETVEFVHQGDDKTQTLMALPRIAHIARLTGEPGHLKFVKELLDWVEPSIHPKGWRSSDPLTRAIVANIENDTQAAKNALRKLDGLETGIGHYIPSISRIMGLAAHTAGDPFAAAAHFEDSIVFCRNAGYSPELAWTCHDYAELLISESAMFDKVKIFELLEEGVAAAEKVGMIAVLERIANLRDSVGQQLPAGLTERQVEILALVAGGLSNPEIGKRLVISNNTVARHLSNIFAKIDASNRVETTTFALANGISANDSSA